MTVRVAACQFGAGADVDANLATALRMIDRAAATGAGLIVLPEFCNHPSWYSDPDHAWRVAVELDGRFLGAIADRARQHGVWVMANATVRRGDRRITDTNVLFDDGGRRLATSDKHVLMGGERIHISPGEVTSKIIESPFGRLGMYSCMDGVINETPRCLALRGAQVLLNSLNSFALDEASLHVPVRAAENRVFVVAAEKVGPLLPEHVLPEVATALGVDGRWLQGAGESQVVAPDGTVLAIAARTGEAVVVADIDPTMADDKRRPDGTDVFRARRPELYGAIGRAPGDPPVHSTVESVPVAAVQAGDVDELVAAVADAVAGGALLVVLPELAAGAVDDVGDAARDATALVARLTTVAGDAHLVTSVTSVGDDGVSHTGVVVDRDGVCFEQRQLHDVARHPWVTRLGDSLATLELPWGRLAVVVGDDSLYPETFRLAALQGTEVVALPFTVVERWELSTGLVERAAENRVNVVAASRWTDAGGSAIVTSQRDFTLWTAWERPFAGSINMPDVRRADATTMVLSGVVHPAATANRLVSRGTDVVDGRPWRLVDAITSPPAPVGAPQ